MTDRFLHLIPRKAGDSTHIHPSIHPSINLGFYIPFISSVSSQYSKGLVTRIVDQFQNMSAEEIIALRQRYELLKGAEHHKNALIEELLRRLDQLTDDFNQEKLDHARESHFNRDVQLQQIQLQDELRKYKALMVRTVTIH